MNIIFAVVFFPGQDYIFIMIVHDFKNKIEYTASCLREQIKSGKLAPGSRLGSSAEIASAFGVSLMTADRAIRKLAAEGMLKRITGVGTFVLNDSPQIRIGVLDDTYCSSRDPHAVIYSENTYPLIELEFMKYNAGVTYCRNWEEIIDLNPDGVLCSLLPPFDLKLKMPVALFRHYELCDMPFIQCVPELSGVMRNICERIRKKHVRKIFIFTSTISRVQYFADSFKRWLELYGLLDITQIIPQSADQEKPAFLLGYRDAKNLPDVRGCAIFVTSDFRASGFLKAFDERGYQPGEYDLISCNNWESYGYRPFAHPRLTSIDFRRRECLEEVVRLLCRTIKTPDNGGIIIKKYPARLKIREAGFRRA